MIALAELMSEASLSVFALPISFPLSRIAQQRGRRVEIIGTSPPNLGTRRQDSHAYTPSAKVSRLNPRQSRSRSLER